MRDEGIEKRREGGTKIRIYQISYLRADQKYRKMLEPLSVRKELLESCEGLIDDAALSLNSKK